MTKAQIIYKKKVKENRRKTIIMTKCIMTSLVKETITRFDI